MFTIIHTVSLNSSKVKVLLNEYIYSRPRPNFLCQVWMSFAQFESSTGTDESMEQARFVKIVTVS